MIIQNDREYSRQPLSQQTDSPSFHGGRIFLYEETAKQLLKQPNKIVQSLNNTLAKSLKYYETDGKEMGALPLLFFGVFYLMATRFIRARNNDERREILIRDIPSAFLAFFGTYGIKRFFARVMDKTIGIPSTYKDPQKSVKLSDWFSRKQGTLYIKSYEELGEAYNFKAAQELKSFNNYVSNLSGKKIFTRLPQKAQTALKELHAYNFFKPESNLVNLAAHKPELITKVNTVLESFQKYIVPAAKMTKVVPDTIATLTTIGLLGWFIPWLNITYTRYRYKGSKHASNNLPQISPPTVSPSPKTSSQEQNVLPPAEVYKTTTSLIKDKKLTSFVVKSSDIY